MNIDKVASIADVVLGLWLLLSLSFLRHSPDHTAIAGVGGVLAVTFGAMAYRGYVWARWLVALLAVVLFVSTWRLAANGDAALVANGLFVATLLFGFSALPTGRGRSLGESRL